jgi:histidinol phosphatase-like enzyme (inositol monophosphatase family)
VTDWLPFLHELGDLADAIALRHFRSATLAVEAKPDDSPVTVADRGIEDAVRQRVRERHRDLGVLGEESGATGAGQASLLVIDPIDGTRNFVRGVPVFATLLAVQHEGEIVAGLVSAPALDQRWHAARGRGAWSGDRQLAVSSIGNLTGAHFLHGSIGGHEEGNPLPGIHALAGRVARTRGFGDFYQHMLVAEGAAEIAVDPVVQAWDIAALQVIVEEAGGRATTLAGTRDIRGGSLVSTNGRLHAEALTILSER